MTLLTIQTQDRPGTPAPSADDASDEPSPLAGAPSPVTAAGTTVSDELAFLLFDQGEQPHIHAPWRALIARSEFSPRSGLSADERTALSYQRLRLVNGSVDSAEALACDSRRLASLVEWSAVVDSGLGTLAAIHYNLFLGSLIDHDGHCRDMSAFASLTRVGTFLCTELDHGNDAAALETTATFDRSTGGFVLHTPTAGARKFMPNTSALGGPKTALVAARLLADGQDHGVFLFLTPLSDELGLLPGVDVQPLPEGIGTPVDHCLTSFDHLWLPREALLEAEHGRLGADGTLHSPLGNRRKRFLRSISRVTDGKLCLSGAAVGVSRTALAIAVRHAHNRLISGPKAGERIPLAAHRSHSGRLLYGVSTAYAMTFLHRAAVSRWADRTEADRAEAERLVAVVKGYNTWQARDIAIECRERCGARGLFTANRLSQIAADLEGTITAEGDNLVVWLKAAGEMIFGHTVDVADGQDLPPGQRRLSDLHFLRDLLARAEVIWQARARQALRQGPSGDPVARWNSASAPALQMVSAHAQVEAADAFLAAVRAAGTPRARRLLEQLCRLFLLRQLTEHSGELLAAQHLTIHHVRGLSEAIETVIGELTPHMMTLVEAFDLPEEVLAAIPLAAGTSEAC